MQDFSWSDPPSQTAFPIAKPGYPLIFAAAFVTTIFALLDMTFLSLLGLVATLFICCFFRDPDRLIPTEQDAVVSPADGKVILAETVNGCPFFEGQFLKISVFMTVFNVHVNRAPHEGLVRGVIYYPGKFFSANLDKASAENEHNALLIETDKGAKLCVVQIAGLVARRIICKVQDGDRLSRGQRFGMICFGSRLDVYLPADAKLDVAVGDKVRAGTSILGYLS
jgi:phosphatidylserine decarboxylase